jgi:hypothetical protein
MQDLVPTPQDVLPLAECMVPHLAKALRLGIGYADDLQPDTEDRDPWYCSHSARWRARGHLLSVPERKGWGISKKAANSGIHLNIQGIHKVRVLRSLFDTVPHPGRNHARIMTWMQGTMPPNDGSLPALSLLADWRVIDDEPVIYVSLPKHGWSYRAKPVLYWRVPVTGDADLDLANLQFDPGLLPGDRLVSIKVDPAERVAR